MKLCTSCKNKKDYVKSAERNVEPFISGVQHIAHNIYFPDILCCCLAYRQWCRALVAETILCKGWH